MAQKSVTWVDGRLPRSSTGYGNHDLSHVLRFRVPGFTESFPTIGVHAIVHLAVVGNGHSGGKQFRKIGS